MSTTYTIYNRQGEPIAEVDLGVAPSTKTVKAAILAHGGKCAVSATGWAVQVR